MKKFIILTIILSLAMAGCKTQQKSGQAGSSNTPDMAHNSMNSLDWTGVYRGVLPCSDCEGIKTEIRLKDNLTYEMKTTYLGKNNAVFNSSGAFQWDDSGNKIILDVKDDTRGSNLYQVGENMLFKLDMDGKRIEGNLAENYTLKKIENNSIIGKHWRLVELQEKSITSESGQGKEAFLLLHEEGNRITGNGGCNHFFGTYELLDGNGIRISQIGATKMMCPDMEQETTFFRTLESVNNYAIQNETLVFFDSPASIAAKFESSLKEY
jgi:copper homeostasis protein (lipoprotein)